MKYSPEQVAQVREYVIGQRDKCLGPDFNPTGAVTLSHAVAMLAGYKALLEEIEKALTPMSVDEIFAASEADDA